MYVRVRGWEAYPGKEPEFEEGLREVVQWIRASNGCVSSDMCRAVGVGQEGRYFTIMRFRDEDSYYEMQNTVRNPKIVPRLQGIGHETWELIVGETLDEGRGNEQ